MVSQKIKNIFALLLFVASLVGSNVVMPNRALAWRNIVFPVIGESTYSNDYLAPRGDRTHYAIDILADRGQLLVAVASGTIIDVQYPQPRWGYSVTIRDDDGYKYTYIHMNDDTPGTDDGKGGGMGAYAADVMEGNRVVKGQLLGRVGDSGHSNNIPHLHFEMYRPDGTVVNPYETLKRASRLSKPVYLYPQLASEILPSGRDFKSNVRIAMGNYDGDIDAETVTATGKGGRYIQVFNANKTRLARFMPSSSFMGGYDIAAGNVDGDPEDEIITGAGAGGSYIKIFNADGTRVTKFAPFGTNYDDGMSVAAGNVDADPEDEIIVGAGKGSGPHVKIFDFNGTLVDDFFAYSGTFKGGIDVSIGNLDELDPEEEIVTSPGPGGGPHVIMWQPDGTKIDEFYPYSSDFRGGVRVSVANIRTASTRAEIATIPWSKGEPMIRLYNAEGGHIKGGHFMEKWWKGYHDIAATEGYVMAATGFNRRDSIRFGLN